MYAKASNSSYMTMKMRHHWRRHIRRIGLSRRSSRQETVAGIFLPLSHQHFISMPVVFDDRQSVYRYRAGIADDKLMSMEATSRHCSTARNRASDTAGPHLKMLRDICLATRRHGRCSHIYARAGHRAPCRIPLKRPDMMYQNRAALFLSLYVVTVTRAV